MIRRISISTVILVIGLFANKQTIAEEPHGTVKAGYIYADEDGNRGVYQPTYNLFEGVGVSLNDFHYMLENGIGLYGDFDNVTLENRKMRFGGSKRGLFNVRFTHDQYTRRYDFDGVNRTRRENSSGSFWAQAHKNIRVFGGFGRIAKSGSSLDLFESAYTFNQNQFDYTQKYFNVGARCNYQGSYLEVEYRGSEFDDDLNSLNDRNTKLYRVSASTSVPKVKNLYANAGFQRFELGVTEFNDSLKASTGWGGLRFFTKSGFHVKYSFIWDRARRSADFVATDKISNSILAGKNWRGVGGFSVGYRHTVNDDIFDKLASDGYLFSGWFKPHYRVTAKAEFGIEATDVEAGQTLTGDKDVIRYRGSLSYNIIDEVTLRARFEDKSVDNDNIGSSADYIRGGTDLSITMEKYGDLMVAYDYLDGDYDNAEGTFNFRDHVIWGNVLSTRYMSAQAGIGGTYVRSKQDVDIESFSLSIMANYLFSEVYKFEIKYSAHNFDDLNNANTSLIYSKYYTANIIEVYISREF